MPLIPRSLVVVALKACAVAMLGGCEGVEAQSLSNTRFEIQYAEFQDALKQCGEQTGYDPKAAAALGLYDIGPGELPWRECAYTALRLLIVPNTSLPTLYMELIDKDKELTRGIAERRVTREQREMLISALKQDIIAREEKAARLESGQRELEERMRIDMISNSMQSMTRNVQRRAR
jgi:hypothetical protein